MNGATNKVEYVVSGGSPAVALSFDLSVDGGCVIDVLTAASLPQSAPARYGRFRGSVDPAVVAALTRQTADSTDAPYVLPHGTVVRSVDTGSGPRVLPLDAVDNQVERRLFEAALESLTTPIAAVEVTTNDECSSLLLRAIGDEPFRAVFFDASVAGYWVRVWRDDPAAPDGRRYVAYDEIETLAEAGKLPYGIADLTPGDTVEVPLPPGKAGGGFLFWRAGLGLQRQIVAGEWTPAGA
jgi:hypothetical protein